MRGQFRRLRGRWERKTWLFVVAGVAVACLAGGGAYAALGGQGRPQSSSDIELQRGLVGWWKMDGNAKDSTPYARNGTLTGTTNTADREGKASAAKLFNGTSDLVTVPNFDNSVLIQGQEAASWSLSAWVKVDPAETTGKDGIIVGKEGYNGGLTAYGTSEIDFEVWSSGGVVTDLYNHTSMDMTTKWHHVVGTYANRAMSLYIDGQLVDSGTAPSGSMFAYSQDLTIGGGYNNYFLKGSVDDVRVYNRALSAAEVTALYNQYDPGVQAASGEDGLVGWWKFDGNAKDSTPNANNGTVTGATLTTDRKGRASSAYNFAATTDAIALPASTVLNTSTFTYSAWVNVSSYSGASTIIGSGSGGPQLVVQGSQSGRVWLNQEGQTAMCSSSNFVALNTWTYVAVTYNGSTGACTLYVNNQSASGVSLKTFSFSNLVIGKRADVNTETMKGVIDDVRIYNRALSASEIAAQYNFYDSQINLDASPTNTLAGGNINAGLVGYWAFNGNAKDATPYSDNGTVTGATLTTDRKGRASSAYLYSGGTNAIMAADSGALNVTGDVTLAAWINASTLAGFSNGQAQILSKRSTGGAEDEPYDLNIRSNGAVGAYWRVASGGDGNGYALLATGSVISTGANYHVVFTRNATQGCLYVNGVQSICQSNAGYGAVIGNSLPLNIGGPTGQFSAFSGTIDEVRIYNRALSATEVQALYQAYE